VKPLINTIVVGLILVSFLFGGWLFWKRQLLPTEPGNQTEISFVVFQAEAANSIITRLKTADLIHSYWVAKLYLQGLGLDQKIRPGSYLVSKNMSMSEIFSNLTSGPKDIWVTIPEGFRREQIAEKFAKPEILALTASLEGKLFPDTYLVPVYYTAAQIVDLMTKNFATKVGSITKEQLILASLVERETRVGEEKNVVAGILLKRLKNGWPLQVDATLQYAQGRAGNWWPKEINTKLPSAYNTYTHQGLPPTPIGNPGLDSILAAQNPQDSPYWYYLHDTNGQIYYAKTLSEHNLNVDKYLVR
jgi:UPF0755 protein